MSKHKHQGAGVQSQDSMSTSGDPREPGQAPANTFQMSPNAGGDAGLTSGRIGKIPQDWDLEGFYRRLADKDCPEHLQAMQILHLMCWNNSVFSFDPFSDEPLGTDLSAYAWRLADHAAEKDQPIRDHVFHLVEFIINEIEYLLNSLRMKILRNHESLPLFAVRETDSKSLQLLARRPGRTIREKLSGRPYMVAVKRRFSPDTQENQLLKAFLRKLSALLILRKERLTQAGLRHQDRATDLISRISFWKTSDTADAIGRWTNNPPNNVLLQDRRYRKIWLGWQRIRTLDQMTRDAHLLLPYMASDNIFWEIVSILDSYRNFRLFQKPMRRPKMKTAADYKKKEMYTFAAMHGSSGKIIRSVREGLVTEFHIDKVSTGKITVDDTRIHAEIRGREPREMDLAGADLRAFARDFILEVVASCGIPKTELSAAPRVEQATRRFQSTGLDLALSCPRFHTDTGEVLVARCPLVQRWEEPGKPARWIDATGSRGILLDHKVSAVQTHTFRCHLAPAGDTDDAARRVSIEACQHLGKILSREIPAFQITYAVPDLLDDFDLEPVRIGISGSFSRSFSVPASIAALNGARKKGLLDDLAKGDLIVAVGYYADRAYYTPVQCEYDPRLEEQLPETRGIQFVRHPTRDFRAPLLTKTDLGCSPDLAARLKTLFDQEGIRRCGGERSFYTMGADGSSVYEHPDNSLIARDFPRFPLQAKPMENYIKKDCGFMLKDKGRVRIILLSDLLDDTEIAGNYSCIRGQEVIPLGAWLTSAMEAELDSRTAIWFDYLPDLQMEAKVGSERKLLYLVKNMKIRPKVNETCDIPIAWTFVLPAGKKFYHFPLVRGNARDKTFWEAYIEADEVLPVDQEISCRLKLTYTYGADGNPFHLVFIPLDRKDLPEFEVQWKLKKDIPLDRSAVPVPGFPAAKAPGFYDEYKTKLMESLAILTNDDWHHLELRDQNREILKGGFRKCATHRIAEITRPRSGDYCFINLDTELGRLEIYTRDDDLDEKKALFNQDQILYYKSTTKQYTSRYNNKTKEITFHTFLTEDEYVQKFPPVDYRKKLQKEKCLQQGKTRKFVANMFSTSLKVQDFGEDFARAHSQFCSYVRNCIATDSETNPRLLDLYMFVVAFSCDPVSPDLLTFMVKHQFSKEHLTFQDCRVCGRLLRNLQEGYQQALFRVVLRKLELHTYEDTMESVSILSKSAWHDEQFIFNISIELFKELLTVCLDSMKETNDRLAGALSPDKENEARAGLRNVSSILELLLGLLRLRRSEKMDEETFLSVYPQADIPKKFLKQIDRFTSLLPDILLRHQKLSFMSFLEIAVKAGSGGQTEHPLIRAVKYYLTEEDDSGAIKIVGLAESDNDGGDEPQNGES